MKRLSSLVTLAATCCFLMAWPEVSLADYESTKVELLRLCPKSKGGRSVSGFSSSLRGWSSFQGYEKKSWSNQGLKALAIDVNCQFRWLYVGIFQDPIPMALQFCKNHSTRPHTCRVIFKNHEVVYKQPLSTNFGGTAESSSYSSTASSTSSKVVWRATKIWTSKSTERVCKSVGGKSYLTEQQAKAEHQRLKAEASKPVIKTASLTVRSNVIGDRVYIDNVFKGPTRLNLDLPQGRHTIRIEKDGYKTYEETINLTDNLIIRGNLEKAIADPFQRPYDSKLDLAYWESIQFSKDPDMFRAYLKNYPTGAFIDLAKIKLKNLGADIIVAPTIPDLDYGRYHSLVIGNSKYRSLKPLRTAAADANAVAPLLESDYRFKVTLLADATRDQIVRNFSRLRREIGPSENLLIYYAGHGYVDEEMDEGFWLPVDAVEIDQVDWISNEMVVRHIRAIKAKHVMVVADSCFSGTLTRALDITIREDTSTYLTKIVTTKARTVLTSGGLEPVTDVGGTGHWVIARKFMNALQENQTVIDGHSLRAIFAP